MKYKIRSELEEMGVKFSKVIGMTDENYNTHDFDDFNICKVCKAKIDMWGRHLLSEVGNVSCVEYIVKSIIE